MVTWLNCLKLLNVGSILINNLILLIYVFYYCCLSIEKYRKFYFTIVVIQIITITSYAYNIPFHVKKMGGTVILHIEVQMDRLGKFQCIANFMKILKELLVINIDFHSCFIFSKLLISFMH